MLLADRYSELRETTRVHEQTLFPPQQIPSELELQARWFAGDFGKHFVTTSGDKVDISSSAPGTARLDRTSRCRDSHKTAMSRYAAASKLISSIATGKRTATRRIRRLKRQYCTFSSKRVTANFSRTQNRTAMYRRFASIPRFCRMRSAQIYHCPDQGAANRR